MSEDDFKRLYLGTWVQDEEYDVAYRAWREYYAATDLYDSQVSDPGARNRHARQRFKELVEPIRGHTDPEKFRSAKMAACRASEKQ